MDIYSSGEDLVIKTRKPYTITKQRERWTEEEHNRFLEALKLYGRAWQRIEEHIGTKTAVQIRSHAQKFFSKLEKEAVNKGVPISQALDIEIPPPRPKRKPSNPYPRKTGVTSSQAGGKDGKLLNSASFQHSKQVLDLEKELPPEKPNGDEKMTIERESESEVFTLLQEAHCSSVSSGKKNSIPIPEGFRNSCSFREFVPSMKESLNHGTTSESYVTIELDGNQKLDTTEAKPTVKDNDTSKVSKLQNSCTLEEKLADRKKSGDFDEMETMQNYPRHVPVHIIDGSLASCMQTAQSDMSFQESMYHPVGELHAHPGFYPHPAASVSAEHKNTSPRSTTQQSFPTFPAAFTSTHHEQHDYRSFLQMSSTFSSLVLSTLLQNPAAHAAASFAATFWPYGSVENSADSPACVEGGFPSRQINSTPSMASIAAATVAAATAWWAAHGLLPVCTPLHAAFTCAPVSATADPFSATADPLVDSSLVPEAKTERMETNIENSPSHDQNLDREQSETLQAQNLASKAPDVSSDSEENGGRKENGGTEANNHEMAKTAHEIVDPAKTKSRKQVDRSSCGSNTPSSSDVEMNTLDKNGKGKEETKEADANQPGTESSGRRIRSTSNVMGDSWKEVSDVGRLAFQALFSREILPQSFSPPHDAKGNPQQNGNKEEQMKNTGEKVEGALLLDLTSKLWGVGFRCQRMELPSSETIREEGILTIGLGQEKLTARRTGFKPYKRCSVEANESRVMSTSNPGNEKGPKRLRLEGEAST